MIKYLFLLMISLTSIASEPKFHYMECVKITQGFYKECTGNAVSIDYSADGTTYDVEMQNCKGHFFRQTFHEFELEKC